MRGRISVFLALLLVLGLMGLGCSSDDDGGTTPTPSGTATGVFRDSKVSGLAYVSGEQSGVTGSDGAFTYELGNSVQFSVGGVSIGSASGKALVSPIDLVPNGSTTNVEVLNIARFLQMLDRDGDVDNGIVISGAVQSTAMAWSSVDFGTNDLDAALSSIISDASGADQFTHVLPSAGEAQAHLESTLICAFAGAYTGTFSGGDAGNFGLLVDANTGFVNGFAYSIAEDELFTLSGAAAISLDQMATFVSGNVAGGATFSGDFNGTDALSGDWSNTTFSISGVFSGNRIGGSSAAQLRYTGSFTGDAYGLFAFDIDGGGVVTGVAYTILAGDGTSGELANLTGSLVGTTLSISIAGGDASATGTLDVNSGVMSGTWSDLDQNTGSFSGSGCTLN